MRPSNTRYPPGGGHEARIARLAGEPVECLPDLVPVVRADFPQPNPPAVTQFDIDRFHRYTAKHRLGDTSVSLRGDRNFAIAAECQLQLGMSASHAARFIGRRPLLGHGQTVVTS